MVETQSSETARSTRHTGRGLGFRSALIRVLAAGGLVVGVLAFASPSWAGPMMGC